MKVAALIVTSHFDEVVWSQGDHERLILAIVFPFTNRRPWKLQGTHFVVDRCERKRKAWEGGVYLNLWS